ncbi:nucleotidyltransferase family protein [Sphingosinicellaceae bacterium]|nr:nucleotidyltransferase family protein [Sphingosinicellaceae bacterium]
MRPSAALDLHRDAVRALIAAHRAVNPRVFGSVAAGTDTEDSDLDLLVDALPGTTLFDLGDLYGELQNLLGVRVDLVTPGDLSKYIRADVVAAARPL